MAEKFQLVLFSDQDSTDAQSTLSSFNSDLESEINLEVPYTLALRKIIFPTNVNNVVSCGLIYYSFNLQKVYSELLPDGFYSSADMIAAQLQKILLTSGDENVYSFKTDNTTQKLILSITAPSHDQSTPFIVFSPNLNRIFKLPSPCGGSGTFMSASAYDIYDNCRNMFIYCNVVRLGNVGRQLRPLIAVTTVQPSPYSSRQQEYEPMHLHRVLIERNSLQSLSFSLENSQGDPFPFAGSGQVVLVLSLEPLD